VHALDHAEPAQDGAVVIDLEPRHGARLGAHGHVGRSASTLRSVTGSSGG
jgi:hypothetical protein